MEAWRRCMIGVVPSVWPDPCPTVAMEAMAMGKPVVASRIGGLTDIVADGDTGMLVPPGDVDALSGALARLTEDASLRTRWGEAGRRRFDLFRAGDVVPRIEQVYAGLLARRSQPADHRG